MEVYAIINLSKRVRLCASIQGLQKLYLKERDKNNEQE